MPSSQTQCLFFHPVLLHSQGCWVSPCQKQGFWELWETLSLNSIIFNLLRITQWFTVFLEETLKDFLAQIPFFSSWLQSLSSRLSIALPASVTQSSLLKYYNCVSSPSCSSAGTRPKVINLSELISSACTLSLSPDVSISHSPVHSRAGNWHSGGWEQWHNRNKSFCAVFFLTLTQKSHPFLSQPRHPHFALQHFLTSHRKNWACSIWWLQNSLTQKLLQFVMPICRNVIDSHIHTYCVSLLKMPEKKRSLRPLPSFLIQESPALQDTPITTR